MPPAATLMTSAQAAHAMRDHYRMEVEAIPLGGERDQNFQIRVGGCPKYVLKLASAAEARSAVDFKVSALLHIEQMAPGLPIQRVVKTTDREKYFPWAGSDGLPRIAYLLSYLPGIPMSGVARSAPQMRRLGALAANLGQALSTFVHPASDYPLRWDLKRTLDLRSLVDATPAGPIRILANRSLDGFEQKVFAILPTLRTQVIHNDLNPHNVLTDPSDGSTLTGVIDFGDMILGARASDIAVTASYLFDQGPDPLAAIRDFLGAYHAASPLEHDEIACLPELIAARLAMTVIITNWRARKYPENRDYILRNQPSALMGLDILYSLSPDRIRQVFMDTIARTSP